MEDKIDRIYKNLKKNKEVSIYFNNGVVLTGRIEHVGNDYLDFTTIDSTKTFIIPKNKINYFCY